MTKTIKEKVQSKKISSNIQKIQSIHLNTESGVQNRKIEPYEQYKYYFSVFFIIIIYFYINTPIPISDKEGLGDIKIL